MVSDATGGDIDGAPNSNKRPELDFRSKTPSIWAGALRGAVEAVRPSGLAEKLRTQTTRSQKVFTGQG